MKAVPIERAIEQTKPTQVFTYEDLGTKLLAAGDITPCAITAAPLQYSHCVINDVIGVNVFED